ncbi:MAG: hypothetical protein LQ344_004451 [Seirophora lacunosa]|nr:MAG: hypothetical protein LQ344_004451 [Seirophora lacunosa]
MNTRTIGQSIFERIPITFMSDEEDDDDSPPSSPLSDHNTAIIRRRRLVGPTLRSSVPTAQLLSPERKAELMAEKILELMDQRADILGISRLSASTKEIISKAMDGGSSNQLLTQQDFDENMRAEILGTREKVLTAIGEATDGYSRAEQLARTRGDPVWFTLASLVFAAFLLYLLLKVCLGLFSLLSVAVEAYATVRAGCTLDRKPLRPW